MKRAAIYARCHDENQLGENIEAQIELCERYAQENGMFIDTAHIYTDQTHGTPIQTRMGLSKLMEAAKAKSFDAILVYDLTRLFRNNAQMLMYIDDLSFLNISLHTIANNINTSSYCSNFHIQLKSIINEVSIHDGQWNHVQERLNARRTKGRCEGIVKRTE